MIQLTGHSQAKDAVIAMLQLIGAALLLFCALSTHTFAGAAPLEIREREQLLFSVPSISFHKPGLSSSMVADGMISAAVP
jgi:hypothetical protein